MNPELLQMLLPYLMQLFGQTGQNGINPLATMFGQNGQNALQQPQSAAQQMNNMQPAGVVGGQSPVGNSPTLLAQPQQQQGAGLGTDVPSPQNAISPTGAPQSLGGIWNSLLSNMQNNVLAGGQPGPTGNSFFGG